MRTRMNRHAMVVSMVSAIAMAITLAGSIAASSDVPFRGRIEGTVTVTPLTPPMAVVMIEGTGRATQLGRFTVEVPHLVNQATRVAVGSYVFTAANGDTLTAEFTGQATLVAPGVLSVAETGVITGGTGRFSGATGHLSAQRTFHVATGVTTGWFDGVVSSPGAS